MFVIAIARRTATTLRLPAATSVIRLKQPIRRGLIDLFPYESSSASGIADYVAVPIYETGGMTKPLL